MKILVIFAFLCLALAQENESWRNTINPNRQSCALKNNFMTQWTLATNLQRTLTNDSQFSTFSLAARGYTIMILTRDSDFLASDSLIVASFFNSTTRRTDIIELNFTGPIENLFQSYTVVPPSRSRIWNTIPRSAYGNPYGRVDENWFAFRINTSIVHRIAPRFIIWYANTNFRPLSWDNFNQDPNFFERYVLLPQGLNETITRTRASPYYCAFTLTNRVEGLHWASFSIVTAIWIVLFILVCVLMILKKQPLYTKGLTPILAIFFQIISLTSSAHYLGSTVQGVIDRQCYFDIFFYQTIFDALYFLLPLHFFRFILVLNINKLKGLYFIQIQTDRKTGQKKQKEAVRWQFKCMNILSRWWIYLILQSAFIGLHIIIVLAAAGGSKFLCTIQMIEGFGNYETAIIVVICVLSVLVVFYDLILNLVRTCKCQKPVKEMTRSEILAKVFMYDYFITDDPYMFRLEFWIYVPLIILFFLIQTILNMTFGSNLVREPVMFFYTLTQVCVMMYMFGHSLFVTIFWLFRDLCCGRQEKEEINLILDDEFGREIFMNFAKQEWSIENISIYDDIQDFFKEKNKVQRQLKATNIYYNYLNGQESKLEVNINKNLCVAFKKKIDSDPDIQDDVFGPILQAVKINLADTYSRLRLRADFKNWKRTRDIQKEQLTGQKVQMDE